MTADVTDFVTIQGIDGDDAQFQSVVSSEDFDLFGNVIGHKVEDARTAEIFGERPQVFLAGEVPAIAIP